MTATPGRWRLALAAAAFVVWAPPTLAALPFAGLVAATRPAGGRGVWLAGAAGLVSGALLVASSGTPLGAAYAAWSVLVAAAFVGGVLAAPAPFWRQATRATALAAIALAGLAAVLWGGDWLGAVRWEATRQARAATRLVTWASPEAGDLMREVAVFVGATIPATFVLQAIAGLALGWQLHVRLAERPLGAPLRPFREFRLGDVWIWGLVLAGGGWLAGQDLLAQNLAVLLGAFYCLQGAAIVVSFAAAVGISTGALVAGAALAAALAVPLVFIVPGMWTLGVTDTWFEYRRRLAARTGSTGA
jgi:hypothetical protein